jgi:hypothetical protein
MMTWGELTDAEDRRGMRHKRAFTTLPSHDRCREMLQPTVLYDVASRRSSAGRRLWECTASVTVLPEPVAMPSRRNLGNEDRRC